MTIHALCAPAPATTAGVDAERPPMVQLDPQLIVRQPDMTAALRLCQTMSGLPDKAFCGVGGVVKDQAQWSRIMGTGSHHFPQDALNRFMDMAGNEAPLLWLVRSRGYDIRGLRRLESETVRRLRLAEERIAQMEHDRAVELKLFRELAAGQ